MTTDNRHPLNLKSKEDSVIHALVPFMHPKKIQELRLHRLEDSGLWVESQQLSEQILGQYGLTMSPKSMVFFLPWHTITFIMGSVDAPTISNRIA